MKISGRFSVLTIESTIGSEIAPQFARVSWNVRVHVLSADWLKDSPNVQDGRHCVTQITFLAPWIMMDLFQTIGAAFGAKKVEVDGKSFTLGIWVQTFSAETSQSCWCGGSHMQGTFQTKSQ